MKITKSRPLSPEERVSVAYQHIVKRVPQDQLARLFGVNQGRVNEACKAIELAAKHPLKVRRLCKSLEKAD